MPVARGTLASAAACSRQGPARLAGLARATPVPGLLRHRPVHPVFGPQDGSSHHRLRAPATICATSVRWLSLQQQQQQQKTSFFKEQIVSPRPEASNKPHKSKGHTTSTVTLRQRAAPYAALARIDKPTGTLLLFMPCAWSLTLATHALHLPPGALAWNTFLFGAGAFIMRGAGCTINDMWDRKLDAHVERTRSRPLASGAVTPFQALTFLGVQLSAGLAILLQLNWYSIALGASSLSLVIIYPFMKRITYWPQFVLGLAFNWGAMLGWAAMAGSLDNAAAVLAPLYAGSICWTLVYDTIYAHQDKVDDVGAGIKSTALLFGDNTRAILSAMSPSMLALLGTGVRTLDASHPYLLNVGAASWGEALSTGHPFFTAALTTSAAHLAWQIWTVDLSSRTDCWSKFRSNTVLGAIIWAGLLLDYTAQVALQDETPAEADAVSTDPAH